MYNKFMSNIPTSEQLNGDPTLLLSPEIIADIKDFAESNRDEYKAYNPDSEDEYFMDCKIYSLKLKRLLNQKYPELNIEFFIVCTDFEEDKILGRIPKHAVHCSLYIKELGIVIEPQTGRILWLDADKRPNAVDYYKKGLKSETISYLATNQITLPRIGAQN